MPPAEGRFELPLLTREGAQPSAGAPASAIVRREEDGDAPDDRVYCKECRTAGQKWWTNFCSRYPIFLLRLGLLVVVGALVTGVAFMVSSLMSGIAQTNIRHVAQAYSEAVVGQVVNYMDNLLSYGRITALQTALTIQSDIEYHGFNQTVEYLSNQVRGLLWAQIVFCPWLSGVRYLLPSGLQVGYRNVTNAMTFFLVNDTTIYSEGAVTGRRWYQAPVDPVTGGTVEPPTYMGLLPYNSNLTVPQGLTSLAVSWEAAVSALNYTLLQAATPVFALGNLSDTSYGTSIANYRLDRLSRFMATLQLKGGLAYVATADGMLLGSSDLSTGTVVQDPVSGTYIPVSVTQSNNQLLKEAALFINRKYGSHEAALISETQDDDVSFMGDDYYVNSAPLVEDSFEMVAVVVIPRRSILGSFDRAIHTTLIIVTTSTAGILMLGVVAVLLVTGAVGRNVHTAVEFNEQEEAARQAQARSEYKTKFLANVSHDLRSPIAGIIGLLDIMLDEELTQEQEVNLRQIKSCATGLCSLLNDLLDLTKVEAGKMELAHVEFDLLSELESMVDLFAIQGSTHGTEVALDVSDEVVENKALIGDPARVRQVLANVISNACKFARGGHVVLRVWKKKHSSRWQMGARGGELGASHTPGSMPHASDGQAPRKAGPWLGSMRRRSPGASGAFSVEELSTPTTVSDHDEAVVIAFEVEDDGIGIPEAQRESIFEAFVQADSSTSRQHGGTGLGLTISRSLTCLMGGDIYIRDKAPGSSGTCFYFYIPFHRPPPSMASQPNELQSVVIDAVLHPRPDESSPLSSQLRRSSSLPQPLSSPSRLPLEPHLSIDTLVTMNHVLGCTVGEINAGPGSTGQALLASREGSLGPKIASRWLASRGLLVRQITDWNQVLPSVREMAVSYRSQQHSRTKTLGATMSHSRPPHPLGVPQGQIQDMATGWGGGTSQQLGVELPLPVPPCLLVVDCAIVRGAEEFFSSQLPQFVADVNRIWEQEDDSSEEVAGSGRSPLARDGWQAEECVSHMVPSHPGHRGHLQQAKPDHFGAGGDQHQAIPSPLVGVAHAGEDQQQVIPSRPIAVVDAGGEHARADPSHPIGFIDAGGEQAHAVSNRESRVNEASEDTCRIRSSRPIKDGADSRLEGVQRREGEASWTDSGSPQSYLKPRPSDAEAFPSDVTPPRRNAEALQSNFKALQSDVDQVVAGARQSESGYDQTDPRREQTDAGRDLPQPAHDQTDNHPYRTEPSRGQTAARTGEGMGGACKGGSSWRVPYIAWLIDPNTPSFIRHALGAHKAVVVSRPLYASRLQRLLKASLEHHAGVAGEEGGDGVRSSGGGAAPAEPRIAAPLLETRHGGQGDVGKAGEADGGGREGEDVLAASGNEGQVCLFPVNMPTVLSPVSTVKHPGWRDDPEGEPRRPEPDGGRAGSGGREPAGKGSKAGSGEASQGRAEDRGGRAEGPAAVQAKASRHSGQRSSDETLRGGEKGRGAGEKDKDGCEKGEGAGEQGQGGSKKVQTRPKGMQSEGLLDQVRDQGQTESGAGEGATAADAAGRNRAEIAKAVGSVLSAQPLEGHDILVAEDTAVLRKVAVITLKKLGAKVTAVSDGQQAVDMVVAGYNRLQLTPEASVEQGSDKHPFSACLMDCAMPVCDGYVATAQIREFEKPRKVHMPIIALTAHAMKSDEDKCLAAGMDAYLQKPLDVARLVGVLGGLIALN